MKKCDICGKSLSVGMTNDEGDFHVHEGACFEAFMNSRYGKGQWMRLGEAATDEYGGFYIATDDKASKGFVGTGIYCTEWEEDEAEDDGVVKAVDIEWDVDEPEDLEDLPKEIVIPEEIRDDEDAISDYISDVTGFCHTGFRLTSDTRKEAE
jgi:hypothetical protein